MARNQEQEPMKSMTEYEIMSAQQIKLGRAPFSLNTGDLENSDVRAMFFEKSEESTAYTEHRKHRDILLDQQSSPNVTYFSRDRKALVQGSHLKQDLHTFYQSGSKQYSNFHAASEEKEVISNTSGEQNINTLHSSSLHLSQRNSPKAHMHDSPEFQCLLSSNSKDLTKDCVMLNRTECNQVYREPQWLIEQAVQDYHYYHYMYPSSLFVNPNSVTATRTSRTVNQGANCASNSLSDIPATRRDHNSFIQLNNYFPYFLHAELTDTHPFWAHSETPVNKPTESAYGCSLTALAFTHQHKHAYGQASLVEPDLQFNLYPPVWHHSHYIIPLPETKIPASFENNFTIEGKDNLKDDGKGHNLPKTDQINMLSSRAITELPSKPFSPEAIHGNLDTIKKTPSAYEFPLHRAGLSPFQNSSLDMYKEATKKRVVLDMEDKGLPSDKSLPGKVFKELLYFNESKQEPSSSKSTKPKESQNVQNSSGTGSLFPYKLTYGSVLRKEEGNSYGFISPNHVHDKKLHSQLPTLEKYYSSGSKYGSLKEIKTKGLEEKCLLSSAWNSRNLNIHQAPLSSVSSHEYGSMVIPLKEHHSFPNQFINNVEEISHANLTLEKKLPSETLSCALYEDGQGSRPLAQSCSPNNPTKVKKAWLTRHSEQFRKQFDNNTDRKSSSDVQKGPAEWKEGKFTREENQKIEPQSKQSQTTKRTFESISAEECSDPYNNAPSSRQQLKEETNQRKGILLIKAVGNISDTVSIKEESKGAITKRRKLDVYNSEVHNGLSSQLFSTDGLKVEKLKVKKNLNLQGVPCIAMPANIQRCRECWARSDQRSRDESLTAFTCRFMNFRRISFGSTGCLKMDGFSTLDDADHEFLHCCIPKNGKTGALDLTTSKYLLSALGDQLCEMIRKEKEAFSWIEGNGKIAWRKVKGVSEMCDFCHHGIFNTHWTCLKCGFHICPSCFAIKKIQQTKDEYVNKNEKQSEWLTCVKGHDHDLSSFIPTQFIPSNVIIGLWTLMHDVRAKYGIKASCSCSHTIASKASPSPEYIIKENKTAVCQLQSPKPAVNCDAPELSKIKEEVEDSLQLKSGTMSEEKAINHIPDQGSKSAEQSVTLCDLLTSTAVKLCLGSTDIGMAFSPVSPTLLSSDRAARILDNIIARVVEKKIQEKLKETGIMKSGTLEPGVPYSCFSRNGILWLHDPSYEGNWKIFQGHWKQCQPIVVSGLQKRLKNNLWKPEAFIQVFGDLEAKVIDCGSHGTITKMQSKEFWDAFLNASCVKTEDGRPNIMKLEIDLTELNPFWMEDLYHQMPVPEYSRQDGKLNLISHLPDNTKSWLGPRLHCVYGVNSENCHIGTTNLTLDVADSLNILVYVESPYRNWNTLQDDIMSRVEVNSLDEVTMKRLQDSNNKPGALWHIFPVEDGDKVEQLLRKVHEEQDHNISCQNDLTERKRYYLDHSLRKRLQEDFGVKCWTLIQFLGDTIFVPAGAPYQCFTGCISVTQGFLSPEHAKHSLYLMHSFRSQICAQIEQKHNHEIESIIYHAVKAAVGTLRCNEEMYT
ncbi:probable JmjC domain-containing histone demethylation protein 2C isoform X2 [Latimeria chalumnae]|uniref:probable JmjC domain-containing histone demethylation protein 2C isoform X2 n=1 Tax=Latimeria chalumnae TaxID=7897 RepID=UPI0006D91F55|nr:PREDICTED: lysine-specific demethylase hairless isoform X2 [Latimeria chalumnae]|eukprot:XP_014341932.1 PREDICTED: lysine-specific demethylase hairless isoform X2 [Latimeria chalumnae]